MKYQVLYRLSHNGNVPGMSMQLIEARNQRELEEALTALRQRWEARGYQIQMLEVNKQAKTRERHRTEK
jgi:hypothetical protein